MTDPTIEIWKHLPSGRAWIVELRAGMPIGCYGPVAEGSDPASVGLQSVATERNGELLRTLNRTRDEFLRIRRSS